MEMAWRCNSVEAGRLGAKVRVWGGTVGPGCLCSLSAPASFSSFQVPQSRGQGGL